jgi:hypothetical protein
VQAEADRDGIGVSGVAGGEGGIGVRGDSKDGFGVQGDSTNHIGVFGSCSPRTGFAAGFFQGPVKVIGSLTVYGAKSAAVPHPDGSHRLLYAVESPESWFEDFGEGRLVRGVTQVRLEPNFAALVNLNSLRVFLTPYGDCNGLYVADRKQRSFEVRELKGGKSNIRFCYRIVGKRKDIKAKRLDRAPPPPEAIRPTLERQSFSQVALPPKPKRSQ